jgi:hypothetical protein
MASRDWQDHRLCRVRYEATYSFGSWLHRYIVVVRQGAIDFHVTEYDPRKFNDQGPSGGLEIHHRSPPYYMADEPPTHDKCAIIGQPCWHDGTSLYASELLIPRWEVNRDAPSVFAWLVNEAVQRFSETEE